MVHKTAFTTQEELPQLHDENFKQKDHRCVCVWGGGVFFVSISFQYPPPLGHIYANKLWKPLKQRLIAVRIID